MNKRMVFISVLVCGIVALASCRNIYNSETHNSSDSYGDVFQGNRIPYDMR